MTESEGTKAGRLDALLPPDMARRAEELGVKKAAMDTVTMFTLGRQPHERRKDKKPQIPAAVGASAAHQQAK